MQRNAEGRLVLSPSDLTGFLACEHLTALSIEVADGRIEKPHLDDPQFDLITRKGDEHERAYLEHLRAERRSIVEIDFDWRDWDDAQQRTLAAMRTGVDVVYQGVFTGDGWRGLADFLIRVPKPSGLGAWSYEALDTKLARTAKPAYLLQLLFYTERLGVLQGVGPDEMHVLLGSWERASFRPHDFAAYYRRVRSRLERFVADPPPTAAIPVSHCGVCGFKSLCDGYWDSVDHLSRVAGVRTAQIERLAAVGIDTLAELGRADPEPVPPGIGVEAWRKIREQAELQLAARTSGEEQYRVLKPIAGTGFALLPEPDPGDLFFDFEGNPFWDRSGGLEYLWGILDVDHEFTPLHAVDHAGERQAFEKFVAYVRARLEQYPAMHVYHYADYEITALKRLMGRYGTCEDELDDLLRRGVFVDLLRVVRNGVRTSRPGYGLKQLEAFLPLKRRAEVKDGGTSIVVFEEWMRTGDETLLRQIDEYNREDCIATHELRDWLLERRAEAIAEFGPLPPIPEDKPAKPVAAQKEERAVLRARLLASGHDLAVQLLDYHLRERKPVWWAYFERVELTPGELLDDRESISGLAPVGEPKRVKRSFAHTLTYPPQEQKIGEGQKTVDPLTRRSPGDITAHDREARLLVLKRGPRYVGADLPTAIVPGGPYETPCQEEALARVGESLLAGDRRYPALESILERRPFDRPVQTTDLDELEQLLLGLDGGHLVIQGPPGSGKTWTSGRLVARLMRAGKTVGVASTSHKAINNLVASVEAAAAEAGVPFDGMKKASEGNPESEYHGSGAVGNVYDPDGLAEADLAAGTAWLFARDAYDNRFDYLFIDEAGQVSLADALAMGTAAHNVVLVGDPQQLDQVLQGTHPAGSDASVLRHLIGGDATIPPDRGIFLERTYRLHPDICSYISDEFYGSRLEPAPVTAERSTPLGTGLRFVPVDHEGRTQDSPEEVERVAAIVAELAAAGVPQGEIVVVAPYNVQVNALRAALPADVRVGTVDKFQGQEADVVIYSLASSSGEDVPRGLGFLLSRHRTNVAISRARCLAYLVASPRLLEVDTRTIDQMRLANALCRYVELAS